MDSTEDTNQSVIIQHEEEITNEKYVDVDEYLEYVGEFGKFQMLVLLIFCFILTPLVYQVLIMNFVANSPTWRCVDQPMNVSTSNTHHNTTQQECRLVGEIGPDDGNFKDRCTMKRSSWEYTGLKDYSIVSDWDLVCGKSYLSYVAKSAVYIGWIFGCLILGWASDRFGRKTVLYPAWTFAVVIAFSNSFVNNIGVFIFLQVLVGVFRGPGAFFIMATELVGPKYRSLAGTAVWTGFTLALCLLGLQAWLVQKWRILMMITTAPYLIVLASYKFIPESVRWLRVNNKLKEATDVLQKVARFNNVSIPENLKLSSPPKEDKKQGSYIDLFVPTSMAISTLIQCFTWFVNSQVYYGISLASAQLGGNMYRDFILTSLVEIPANVLVIYCTNRFGRKPTVIYNMFGGGVTCIAIAFVPSHTNALKAIRVTLGMLGKLFITISFNSVSIWSVELYPTVIRAQGFALLVIINTIGGASAPWVAQFLRTVHKVLPFTIMGVLTLISAVLCFKLKETYNMATSETLVEPAADDNKPADLLPLVEPKSGRTNQEQSEIDTTFKSNDVPVS